MVVCGKIDLREPINGMPELWWLMTLPEVALLTQRCVDGVPESSMVCPISRRWRHCRWQNDRLGEGHRRSAQAVVAAYMVEWS